MADVPAVTDIAALSQSIQAMMAQLTATLAAHQAPAAEVHRVAPKEPKVRDPDFFKGSRTHLTSFLTEVELIFRLQSSRFGNDETKVNYVISLLRDKALLAITPFIQSEDPDPMLSDYSAFVKYLRVNFGDPDEKGSARRKLKSLKQVNSASEYFAEFRQFIAILGWKDEEPIADRAQDGLKSNLKDEIARHGVEFTTLEDLIQFIVPLDNRLHDREVTKRAEEPKVAKPPATVGPIAPTIPVSPTQGVRLTPVATTPGPSTPATPFVPRGPLTAEEKERRRALGLCNYCGNPGHIANACPNNKRPGFVKQEQSPSPNLDQSSAKNSSGQPM